MDTIKKFYLYQRNKLLRFDYTQKKLSVIYIYKDFDTYNGLIKKFLLMAKRQAEIPFDFEVLVFKNKEEEYATLFRNNRGKLINLGFKWSSNPLILLNLVRLLRRKRPDIVQTFILKPNLFGILASLLAKVPVRIATDLTLIDQAPTKLRRLRDKFLYRIYKHITRWADHVVCVSEAVKNEFLKLGLYCNVSVIYSPVDVENAFSKDHKKLLQSNELNGGVVIGIVGRLSEEKGHADLLRAFYVLNKKYGNLRLLIVGDGPLRKDLELLSKKLRIEKKVNFTGFQKDVYKYLDMMDIFVLPSRTEGLGTSILEAMISGLPVVASRVGGIPEIVDDGINGILIEYGRVDQLVTALSVLIEDQAKRREYGGKGKEKVLKRHSPEKFIEDHYNLYVSLLEKKGLIWKRS